MNKMKIFHGPDVEVLKTSVENYIKVEGIKDASISTEMGFSTQMMPAPSADQPGVILMANMDNPGKDIVMQNAVALYFCITITWEDQAE